MAMGTKRLIAPDGATDIMTEFKACCAPGAPVAVYHEAENFSGYWGYAETIDDCCGPSRLSPETGWEPARNWTDISGPISGDLLFGTCCVDA